MSRRACVLCGSFDQQLVFVLIRWREAIGQQQYVAAPRCVDRPGCRARVEAAGEKWEVDDDTPPPPAKPVEPAEPAEPAEADAGLEAVFG